MCGKGGGAAAVPFEDPLWNFKRGGARPLRAPPLNPLVGMGSRDRPARSVPVLSRPLIEGIRTSPIVTSIKATHESVPFKHSIVRLRYLVNIEALLTWGILY